MISANRHLRFAALAALLLGASAGRAAAAAWTLPQGEAQAIVTAAYAHGPDLFDADGDRVAGPDFEKVEIGALFEYGLRDGLTLMLQPTVQQVDIGAPVGESQFGLGYTELGARLRLADDAASALSAQAAVRIPGAQDDRAVANIGATDPDLDLRVLYGRGFRLGGREAFFDVQAGYRVRFGDPAGEVRADVTLGVRVRDDVSILGQSFNVVSAGRARGVFTDTRYHKAQLSAVWDVDDAWSVQFGVLATVAGENALAERGLTFGLWRTF